MDTILATFDGETLILWDTRTWLPTSEILLEDEPDQVEAGLDFSQDGRWLAWANIQTLMVWDMKEDRQAFHQVSLEKLLIAAGNVAFTPDGSQLLTANHGVRAVGSWEPAEPPNPIPSLGGNVLVPLSNGDVVLAGINELKFWAPDWTTHSLGEREHQSWIIDAVWSPDGRRFATASEDASVVLWDANRRKKITRFRFPSAVWSLTFSPNGHYLTAGVGDGSIRLIDMITCEPVLNLNEHMATVRAVAFSPDGTVLASAGDDNLIMLWSVSNGRKLRVLRQHTGRVPSLAFSSDGHWLVSAGGDESVLVWNVSNPNEARLHARIPQKGATKQAVFHPKKNEVFASINWRMFRWDIHSGKDSVGPFLEFDKMSFTKDGTWLACGGDYYHLFVWDPSAEKTVRVLPVDVEATIYAKARPGRPCPRPCPATAAWSCPRAEASSAAAASYANACGPSCGATSPG